MTETARSNSICSTETHGQKSRREKVRERKPALPHHQPFLPSHIPIIRSLKPATHLSSKSPNYPLLSSLRNPRRTCFDPMGSFKGHVLPGSLFLVVGLWHVWSAAARYVGDRAGFRCRAWSPVGKGRLRHLELWVVAGGALLDMGIELLYSTHLNFFVGKERILNPAHMNDFEHAGMLFMFFIFGAAALLSQNTRYLPLSDEVLCLLAAAAFSGEYLLFYFHSTSHMGLEGYYHFLLVIVVGVCVASCVSGALFPTSFPVDIASGASIALQGLWFYQTAFTLYGPMMPRGCSLGDSGIVCRSHDSQVRGELIANLQLFYLVFLVFAYVLGCYAISYSWYGQPDLRATDSTREALEGDMENIVAH